MEFVGRFLKKSRKDKKIDIETISKELNIAIDLIENIEDDNFPQYLDKVYLTGHIRAYAKYLGLNSNEVVKKFSNQFLCAHKDILDELPRPLVKDSSFIISSKSISLFSIVFISTCFYFLFIKSNNLEPNYSIIPDLPENLQSEIEEIEMEIALKATKKTNPLDSDNNFLKLDQNIVDHKSARIQSSAVASLPFDNDFKDFNYEISLKFLKSTWIQLRDKQNQIVLSKLMNQNDEYTYLISDNYSLTSGNAGNILVLINGEIRGKAGKSGEVIDSLFIHSDFNN